MERRRGERRSFRAMMVGCWFLWLWMIVDGWMDGYDGLTS